MGVHDVEMGSFRLETGPKTAIGAPSTGSSAPPGSAFATSNPDYSSNYIPSGAITVGESHSHPSPDLGWAQTPSTQDWSRQGTLNIPSAIGLIDGSVLGYSKTGYDPTTQSITNNVSWGMAPPLPGGVSPFQFLDRTEAPGTLATTSSTSNLSSGSIDAGAGADGGFLLYPNKTNNNGVQNAYHK